MTPLLGHYYTGQRKAEPSQTMKEGKITMALWDAYSNRLSFVLTEFVEAGSTTALLVGWWKGRITLKHSILTHFRVFHA